MRYPVLAFILFSTPALAQAPQNILSRDSEGRGRASEPVDGVEAGVVLQKAFGTHLRSTDACPNTQSSPGQDLQTGQFFPMIVTRLRGAFTTFGIRETLYIVDMGECSSRPHSSKRLIITHQNNIVFNTQYAEVSTVAVSAEGTLDLNHNGINEWVRTWSYCRMGGCTEGASIVHIYRGQLQVIADLGEIYSSSCCSEGKITWSTVTWLNGPRIQKHNKKCTCR